MRKIFIIGIMIPALMIMLISCSKTSEIAAGIYRADGDMAEIIVQDDNTIIITGPKEVSAAFTGEYVIDGSKLVLSLAEQEDYVFLINDQGLVLVSGEWLENWVEQGTIFYFSK